MLVVTGLDVSETTDASPPPEGGLPLPRPPRATLDLASDIDVDHSGETLLVGASPTLAARVGTAEDAFVWAPSDSPEPDRTSGIRGHRLMRSSSRCPAPSAGSRCQESTGSTSVCVLVGQCALAAGWCWERAAWLPGPTARVALTFRLLPLVTTTRPRRFPGQGSMSRHPRPRFCLHTSTRPAGPWLCKKRGREVRCVPPDPTHHRTPGPGHHLRLHLRAGGCPPGRWTLRSVHTSMLRRLPLARPRLHLPGCVSRDVRQGPCPGRWGSRRSPAESATPNSHLMGS